MGKFLFKGIKELTLAFARARAVAFKGGQYLARAMGDPQPPTDQILSSEEQRKNLDYSAVGIFSTAF